MHLPVNIEFQFFPLSDASVLLFRYLLTTLDETERFLEVLSLNGLFHFTLPNFRHIKILFGSLLGIVCESHFLKQCNLAEGILCKVAFTNVWAFHHLVEQA